MKQDYDGKVETENQEIGGPIEDEANAVSGQIVKSYIKNHLTKEQRKFLVLELTAWSRKSTRTDERW